MDSKGSYGTAVRVGVIVGLVVALTLVGFAIYAQSTGLLSGASSPDVVVVAGLGSARDGSNSAEIVGVVDLEGGVLDVTLIDPESEVTIPGTTYATLRDSYSFGGGRGVADAVGRLKQSAPVAWLVVTPEGCVAIVDGVGGVTVDVPETMDVFVSGKLHSLSAGEQQLTGGEFAAALSGTPFIEDSSVARVLRRELTAALLGAVSTDVQLAESLRSSGDIKTSLSETGFRDFLKTVGARSASLAIK